MTLRSIAGRMTSTILVHLLVFGGVFYILLAVPAFSDIFTNVTVGQQMVMMAVILTMATLAVGVGIGAERRWYKSPSFWRFLCAGGVTALVITAAHNITFGPLTEVQKLADSITSFYVTPVALLTMFIVGVSTVAYIYLSQSGEPVWETLVSVLMVGAVATIAFATAEQWALLMVVLSGVTFAVASRGHVDDMPTEISSLNKRRASSG